MANRYPIIFNSSSNQFEELTSGDNLNLLGNSISDVINVNASGIITAATLNVQNINIGGTSIGEAAKTNNYNDLDNKPTLFSGDYNDLTNKPTGISVDWPDITNKPVIADRLSQLVNDVGFAVQSDLEVGLDQIVGLSEVGKTGSWNDLLDRPTFITQDQLLDGTITIDVNNTGDLNGRLIADGDIVVYDNETNRFINPVIDGAIKFDAGINVEVSSTDDDVVIVPLRSRNISLEAFDDDNPNPIKVVGIEAAFDTGTDESYSQILFRDLAGNNDIKLIGPDNIKLSLGGFTNYKSPLDGPGHENPIFRWDSVYTTFIDSTAVLATNLEVKEHITTDDSTILVDTVLKEFYGDLKGSVFSDDSTLIVDGLTGNINAQAIDAITVKANSFNGSINKTGALLNIQSAAGVQVQPGGIFSIPNATSVVLAATQDILIQSTDNLNLISSSGIINVNTSIVPDTTEAYDLGTSDNRFRDLYLSGSTINLGGTTISAQGGSFTIGSSNIGVSGFYDQPGDLAPERTAVTLKSGGFGPFTTGAVIYDTILFDPAEYPTPFDGQARPIYSTTKVGDNVTAITGIIDSGKYLLDGAGDDYPLFIGPADPINEPYLADGTGFAYTRDLQSSTFPNGTYTATFTSGNGETLSINYTVTDRIGTPGAKDVAVNSVTQSGAFIAGEIPAHPVIPGYDGTVPFGLWQVNQLDPTTLYFGADSSVSDIDFYLGSNMGAELIDSSGNNVFINLEPVVSPTNQTAKTLSVSNVISIGTSTVPPTSPQDGDIALADGVNWDPVATGKKTLVIYLSSTWVQIAVAP